MNDKQTLAAHLSFVYRLIVASEGLLERAIARETDIDRLAYFRSHLAEEAGHAQLLAEDLRSLGVTDIPRFHLAELMAGSQYYLIEHEHPAALLGYMAALERAAPSPALVDVLESKYGALRCVRLHADNDPGHCKELIEQMGKLPEKLRALAAINYQRVVDQLIAAPSIIDASLGVGEVRH